MASSPVEVKVPQGFSLQEGKLKLPNGNTIENVTGLHDCAQFVLIVSPAKVWAYNKGQKKYDALALPPLPPMVSYELRLIPFNAEASIDQSVAEKTAFVTLSGAEKAGYGVYRYRAGEEVLEFIPIMLRRTHFESEFKSWRTYKSDVVGEARKTAVRIDLDLPPLNRGYYSVQRVTGKKIPNGQDMLQCIKPPSQAQIDAQLEAFKAKHKAETDKHNDKARPENAGRPGEYK